MRFFLIFLAFAGMTSDAFADLSEERFVGQTKDFHYAVEMRFKPARAYSRYSDAHEAWTIFDAFRVTLDGREISVPKTVLDHLFWPHPSSSPYPGGAAGTLCVPITGSSGEYFYEAVLVFSKTRVVQIKRRDGASTTWKTTKYRVR